MGQDGADFLDASTVLTAPTRQAAMDRGSVPAEGLRKTTERWWWQLDAALIQVTDRSGGAAFGRALFRRGQAWSRLAREDGRGKAGSQERGEDEEVDGAREDF